MKIGKIKLKEGTHVLGTYYPQGTLLEAAIGNAVAVIIMASSWQGLYSHEYEVIDTNDAVEEKSGHHNLIATIGAKPQSIQINF